MKTQVLKQFKERVRNLNKVLSKIIVVWDNPQYEVISVLLQNLGFDSTECVGYSNKKDVERCEDIIKALREIKDFDGHHLIKWIFTEVDSYYTAYSFED
jgi:hypothetical protein